VLQIKALRLCGRKFLDSCNRVKSENAKRNVSINTEFLPRLTRSASALRKVGEGFLDVRFSDLRISTQRFFVKDTGLPVFSSRSVGNGGGGAINTQVRANRPGNGCQFTKDKIECTLCVL
jgi:hypothetical protein